MKRMKLDLFDNLSLPNNNNYNYNVPFDHVIHHHHHHPFFNNNNNPKNQVQIAQVQSLELSLFLNQEYSKTSSSSLLPIYPHVGQKDHHHNDNNTIQVDLHWRNNNNNNNNNYYDDDDHALEESIMFSFQPQWQPPQPPQISLNCISYGYELGEHLIDLNEINEITSPKPYIPKACKLKYQMMNHHEEPLMHVQANKSFLLDSQQIKSPDHHFLLDSQHMDLSQFHCLFNATREIMTLSADIPSLKKINGNLLLFLISLF